MTKNTVMLAAGTLLFIAISGIALLLTNSLVAGTVMLVGALPGLVWLYRYDLRREEREASKEELRFRELSALSRSPDFALTVSRPTFRRFSGISIGTGIMFVIASLGVPAAQSFASTATMSLGLIFIVGGLAFLFTARTKPVLRLSRIGIESDRFGSIPWERVHGVYLQDYSVRSTRVEGLMFRIPDVRSLASQFRGPLSWVYRHRPRSWPDAVTVLLTGTSESSQVVYRIARQLWTEMTGRDDHWDPVMSAEFNVAVNEMKKADAFLRDKPALNLDPHRIEATLNTVAKSSSVVSSEIRRKMRIANVLAWSGVLIFVVYVATTLWKYFA